MRKLFSCLLGLLLFTAAKSQANLSPSVIAAGGGVSKFPGIELEWTLGEAAAGTAADFKTLYTIGFHQPLLTSTPVLQDNAHAGEITVFPNPVANILQVKFNFKKEEKVSLTLTDPAGRILSEKTTQTSAGIAEIQVKQYSPGTYYLEVRDTKGKAISSFKIIKTN